MPEQERKIVEAINGIREQPLNQERESQLLANVRQAAKTFRHYKHHHDGPTPKQVIAALKKLSSAGENFVEKAQSLDDISKAVLQMTQQGRDERDRPELGRVLERVSALVDGARGAIVKLRYPTDKSALDLLSVPAWYLSNPTISGYKHEPIHIFIWALADIFLIFARKEPKTSYQRSKGIGDAGVPPV